MTCTEVKELLSAYFDGELSAERHLQVRRHVEGCPECLHELDGFGRLSQLATESIVSPPPAEFWQRVESDLDQRDSDQTSLRQPTVSDSNTTWHTRRWSLWTAIVLVIPTLVVFGYRSMSPSHEHHQFTTTFGEYLDRFRSDPYDAQSFLLSQYPHEPVQPDDAVDRVGYRPIVAGGLPDGYSLVSTHVMRMPCCTCVQSLCHRADGTTLAIFEHDEEEPDWFGARPTITVTCQSMPCSLVELSRSIAASWKFGKRHITLIGAEDLGEVDRLVAWLSLSLHFRIRP